MRTHLPVIRMLVVASIVSSALIGVAPAQVVQSWATVLNDGGRSDSGDFVVVDPGGDVIVGGISQTDTGDADLRLARLSSTGVVIWSQRFPFGVPNGWLQVGGLTQDPAGNILVLVGQYLGGVDSRTVTVKVSGAGTELWRAIFDTPGALDSPAGIVRDAAGQVFVSGTIEAGGNGQPSDIKTFLVSYGPNGNLLWQDTYGNGRDQQTISDITRDPANGAIYIAGDVSGQNAGPLLLRYDPNGRRRWAKKYPTLGGSNDGAALKVRVGPDGQVVMASFVSTTRIDIQLTKVDAASGKALWSTLYGDPNAEERVFDLAFDSLGNVTVFGLKLIGSGSGHPLLIRYTPSGQFSWDSVDSQTDGASSLPFALDAAGSAYFTGPHTVPFGMGFTNLWRTTRYDSAGQPVWAIEYDGSPTIGTNGIPHDLALTSGGDVIVAGEVNGDIHVVSYSQP